MKKYTFIILLLLLTCLTLPVALASDYSGTPRFTDTVGLLDEQEVANLTGKLNNISLQHQFDVVITITYSLDGKDPRVWAADFFENQGFGQLEKSGGIILMLAMEERDFAFVTTAGYGDYAFSYSGQEYLEKLFLPYLRNDNYFDAFMAFANAADDFLTRAAAGIPYVADNIPKTSVEKRNAHITAAVVSLVLAFSIPGIVVFVWTRQLKSVKPKDFACEYIRRGSMMLNMQRDIFLYRNVTKVAKAQNNSSGGSGRSGGFSSSSGGSFSGRSGKF